MQTITYLESKDLDQFYEVFVNVLHTQLSGYSSKVLNYLTTQIYPRHAFALWLTDGSRIIITTKENKTTVGFAVLDRPYGGVSHCRWLGVAPEHQRKGIGTKIVIEWIRYAKSVGCHKIELAGHPQARGFYEAIGLESEGKKQTSYFGVDLYMFGKVIGEPDEHSMTR